MGHHKSFRLLLLVPLLLCACAQHAPDLGEAARAATAPDSTPRRQYIASLSGLTSTHSAEAEEVLRWVGEATVVQLGEESHGDGATFLAKTALVKLLHERKGFDTIAFESSFYDCARAWEARLPTEDVARLCLYRMWYESAQVAPLFDYIDSQRPSAHPLAVAGIDFQLRHGTNSYDFISDIKALFKRRGLSIESRDLESLERCVNGLRSSNMPPFAPSALGDIVHSLEAARASVSSLRSQSSPDPEIEFWVQALENMITYSTWIIRLPSEKELSSTDPTGKVWFHPAKRDNPRDSQMAGNVMWLTTSSKTTRKVIVWAANIHIANTTRTLDTLDTGVVYDGLTPMGAILRDRLGERLFTIGATAFSGQAALAGDEPTTIDPAPIGSLEQRLVSRGVGDVVLCLHCPGSEEYQVPLKGQPLGYSVMAGNWSTVFDALIFHTTMTPSTKR